MEINLQERVFFQDSNVTITQSRYVVGDNTYSIRNITSVSNFKVVKSSKGASWLICFGIFLLIYNSTRILGGILIVAGIFWILPNDKYSVKIITNAGETYSLTSKNREYIQKIVDALNEAIIQRG